MKRLKKQLIILIGITTVIIILVLSQKTAARPHANPPGRTRPLQLVHDWVHRTVLPMLISGIRQQ